MDFVRYCWVSDFYLKLFDSCLTWSKRHVEFVCTLEILLSAANFLIVEKKQSLLKSVPGGAYIAE
ncbi:uncharacterized protein J3R85_012345 [Psidium guajava]|nr:uncharacterized protein J3R85_012345 [Psidium guajava]